MLMIEQLSIKYGAATAVLDASIQVQKAELVAILGANGAGKSSLGKAIAGLVKSSGASKFCFTCEVRNRLRS
jgi:branched-chain amino acid transport system ATP-binding protein